MTSRRDVREEFAALVNATLVRDGLLQKVYDYEPGTFDTNAPVLTVGSAGTQPTGLTGRGDRETFFLDATVFVPRQVEDAGGNVVWTEQDAEDTLDAIDNAFRAMLAKNRRGRNWKTLAYVERSQASAFIYKGISYLSEYIPLQFEYF